MVRFYRVAKKLAPFLYDLNVPNINRFSKLLHYHNQEKICNNIITKDRTTPQVCPVLTSCYPPSCRRPGFHGDW